MQFSPIQWLKTHRRARLFAVLSMIGVLIIGLAGGMITVSRIRAASYCQVSYTITGQWPGNPNGFNVQNIFITNTSGSAWSSWTLTWTFPAAGQTVAQGGWNGNFSQSGQNVTVTNANYNGNVANNAQVNPPPGFNGTYTTSNPVPTNFAVNGNACNGSVNPTPTPTTGSNTPTPTSTPISTGGQGPCDIYASGGTPCVAAHSTVRALFGNYTGNLYQVQRSSDNATLNIGVLSPGGFANAAAQDTFCAGTSCVISILYDQSGHGNNLTRAPGGGAVHTADNLAVANALPLTVGGHHVYGIFSPPGTGYRDDSTNGIATGDNPEGEYAIMDGTHFNGGCCFDYGNAETNNNDDGNGTMEAISFGNINIWGTGSGRGPWVYGDLENGLWTGAVQWNNPGDQSITFHYVTAIVKGTHNLWAIKAGNAQSGSLTTMWNGQRPTVSGYNPMHKQGAIILGIGGDNSNGADGNFYEGAMTSGYPSDATENAVQANIVAAGYGR
jgi:non-reducing end alpha-L-arabinofuranosidase